MTYVVVYICAAWVHQNDCNERTARAYQALADPVVVCGLHSQMTIVQSAIAPDEHEYLKVKCARKPY